MTIVQRFVAPDILDSVLPLLAKCT